MTNEEYEEELAEKKEDIRVFEEAYNLLHDRLVHLEEHSRSRIPASKWAGATGIVDLLNVVKTQMQRVAEEIEADQEALVTESRPRLSLVPKG